MKGLLVLFSLKCTIYYVHLIVSISLNLIHFALQWLKRNWYNRVASAAGGHALMLRDNCPKIIIKVQKNTSPSIYMYLR